MSLNKKKIFLAGSTGMVGRSILRYILDRYPSAKIRASIHLSKPIVQDGRIEYVRGDLRQLDDCRRMLKGCNCAIMAASYAGGAAFMKSFPWEHMKENLLMNFHILEAVRLEHIKRFILIGSATLYQEFEGKIREDELDWNVDPHEVYFGYGWAMRFIEKMCNFLHDKYGLEVVMVRASNIFGPYAKFDPESSNFIPAIIRKAVDRMNPFEVWGTSDVTRDVLYIDDFARAVAMIIDNDGIKFDIFNIGSGRETAIGDVVQWVLKYTGHKPSEIRYAHNKPTTIKSRQLDCSKAKRLLGWEPEFSIEEGVKRTTEWWLANKDTWKK